MLDTNLATRPFYNIRAVRAVLVVCSAAVLALVLFDVVQLVNLTTSQRSLGARAADAERLAERLRAEAADARRQIDPEELQIVAKAAREANEIIDRRSFSWTELFERFERTLPPDVRITAVQPNTSREGAMLVTISVEAREAEDLDAFVEALDADEAFSQVLPTQAQMNAEGLIAAVIESAYTWTSVEAVSEASGQTVTSAAEVGR